ncbi:MAG: class I SAM-dependent methyltransferase [Methylocystis sp.]
MLDVGCGDGALASEFARRGAIVIALDPDLAMIAATRRRIDEEGPIQTKPHMGRRPHQTHRGAANDPSAPIGHSRSALVWRPEWDNIYFSGTLLEGPPWQAKDPKPRTLGSTPMIAKKSLKVCPAFWRTATHSI